MITRVIHTGLTVILNFATKISENNKNERSLWNMGGKMVTSNTGTSIIENGNIVVGTSKTVTSNLTSNFKVGN